MSLCQYSKKFDSPGACLVSQVELYEEAIDPGSTLCFACSKSSLHVENVCFLEVDLKSKVDCTSCKLNKKGIVSLRDGHKC